MPIMTFHPWYYAPHERISFWARYWRRLNECEDDIRIVGTYPIMNPCFMEYTPECAYWLTPHHSNISRWTPIFGPTYDTAALRASALVTSTPFGVALSAPLALDHDKAAHRLAQKYWGPCIAVRAAAYDHFYSDVYPYRKRPWSSTFH